LQCSLDCGPKLVFVPEDRPAGVTEPLIERPLMALLPKRRDCIAVTVVERPKPPIPRTWLVAVVREVARCGAARARWYPSDFLFTGVGVAWVGVTGVGVAWVGVAWVGVAWVGVAWVGVTGVGVAWVGVTGVGVAWVEVTGVGVTGGFAW